MVVVSVVVALMLWAGAVVLLSVDTFFLTDRWDPRVGHLFAGVSRYLLAGALAGLGVFAVLLGRDWFRGAVPSERGAILLRYWPVVAIALACLVGAFMTAERMPNPALRSTSLLAPWPPDRVRAAGGGHERRDQGAGRSRRAEPAGAGTIGVHPARQWLTTIAV